jgi:hypothetical protein
VRKVKTEIKKLLQEYHKRFGDKFPTECFEFGSEEQLAELVKRCLDQGKPAYVAYNLVFDGSLDY